MKKALFSFAIVAAALLVASCGNKGGNTQATDEKEAEAVVPDGYKTHEFSHFFVSVPDEFSHDGENDYGESTSVRFYSEAMVKHDDGEEYSSSATIDCGFMTGGSTPSQIKETATNLKLGREATGDTCDEPIIDGNTILMRTYYDGVITWRWWIVSDSGNNIAGNICYPETEAKYYDGMAQKIVKTIKFK